LRLTNEEGFPTILVIGNNDDGVEVLVERLRFDGYLILVAANFDDALHIVRIHPRQIHVLVACGSVKASDASDLAAMMTFFWLGVVPVVSVNGQRDVAGVLSEIRKVCAFSETTNEDGIRRAAGDSSRARLCVG
jgi:CheY-like chemotaxis protein